MTTQLITPNPDIPAEEGMCLQYVRQAFGLPLRYGSATEAWNNSPSRHRDRSYPPGVWFPVWWELDKNVNGHVALVAPDGSVYSTSNLNPNPVKHHPSISDVEAYYAYYGMTLTYRGWTEDVAGYPVISTDSGSINFDSITTTPAAEQDVLDIMAASPEEQDAFIERLLNHQVTQPDGNKNSLGALLQEYRGHYLTLVNQTTRPRINAGQAEDIVQAVLNRLPNAVLNANVPLTGGANASLAWVLDALNSKPSGTVTAAVDVDAIVARLKSELPSAILPAIAAKLTN